MSNKSTPADITIEYDNSSGTPVDITAYVLEINDVEVEGITEEMHPFGTAWEQHLPVGVGRVADIELTGLYDDQAASGPDALFANRIPENPATSNVLRTLTVTWEGSKTTSVETILSKYTRTADRNALTRWTATLKGSAAVTEV